MIFSEMSRSEVESWICQTNIERFRSMLEAATDAGRRQHLADLLAREEQKLKELEDRLNRRTSDDPGAP